MSTHAANRDEAMKCVDIMRRAAGDGDAAKANKFLAKALALLSPDEGAALRAECATAMSVEQQVEAGRKEFSMEQCDFCLARGVKFFKCSSCRMAKYCSKECQYKGWNQASNGNKPHKQRCEELTQRHANDPEGTRLFNAWYRRNHCVILNIAIYGLLWSTPTKHCSHAVQLSSELTSASGKGISVSSVEVVPLKVLKRLRRVGDGAANAPDLKELLAIVKRGERMLVLVSMQGGLQPLVLPMPDASEQVKIAEARRRPDMMPARKMMESFLKSLA